jgi:hypothetical protein
MNKIFYFLIVGLLFCGCSVTLEPQNYASYFEKNKKRFTLEQKRFNVNAQLTYLPVELFIARVTGSDGVNNKEAVTQYKNSIFFHINIIGIKKMGKSGSGDTENLFGADFQNQQQNNRNVEAFLINNKDTIRAVSCQFERFTPSSENNGCLLSFSRTSLKKELKEYTLVVRKFSNDIGTVEFAIKSIVTNIPKLKV